MSENSESEDTDDQGRLTRRDFLKRTGASAAVLSTFPTIIPQNVQGANDQINVAVVGIRGRGGSHISQFAGMENVHVKTICDVDENLFADRIDGVREEHGYEPETEHDMRRVFEDPEIDVVGFATPNHWHALGAIWAAQAGKHVYVEKPASHRLWEGRQMVHAARANDVLMQVGFQNRSRQSTRSAIQFLREGGIGDIYMARGLCYKPRWNIGRYPNGPMPEDAEPWTATTNGEGGTLFDRDYLSNVHYDRWLGPAPKRPFNPNRFHYNWHWQWAYGNGDTGNQGPHQIDIGRWGLGKEEYPETIKSSGDYFVFEESAQNTPNTQTTIFEYDDGTIFEFATRGLFTPADGETKIGNVFYGSEGWMEVDAGGNWQTYFGYEGEPGPNSEKITEDEEYDPMDLTGAGGGGHFANFIAAVRSGNREDLTCDIEVGHRSTALAHLGNISYRLDRELEFDGDEEQFVDDDEADAMLKREEYRDPYVVPDLS